MRALRRAADGRRGARRRRARRARRRDARELLGVADRVDLRMGTFSKSLASCGGFVAGPHEVIDYLRISSRAFLFTASAVPAAVGAALAALRVLRSRGRPAAAGARARERPASARRPAGARLRRRRPSSCPPTASRSTRRACVASRRAARSSRRSCPCWSATTGRRRCCGARSTTPGVFVNTALHPAVPPGGALLRTSVMATHDAATLARALEIFARVKRDFEAEHGPLPGRASTDTTRRRHAFRHTPSQLAWVVSDGRLAA